MIYYDNGEIVIRDMVEGDARIITDEEIAQGWRQSVEKYETRLRHRAQGRCFALVAEYRGSVAGYIHVYPNPGEGAFARRGFPEIVDLGVLEKYRRRGIGTALMDAAEKIAARYADTVCLAVGLHSEYGSAQRMYVRRGYLPDGSGAWYRGRVCPPYADCANDDDLVLYLSRKLSPHDGGRDGQEWEKALLSANPFPRQH